VPANRAGTVSWRENGAIAAWKGIRRTGIRRRGGGELPTVTETPETPPRAPSGATPPSGPEVCVVFGASGGIGSAVVRELLARQVRVLACARRLERLQAAGFGSGAELMVCDVMVPEQVEAALLRAGERLGPVTGIAHCVGSMLLKPAHLTSDAEWQDVLRQNLTSAFHVVRAAGKLLRQGGSVVLCSSAAAGLGMANHEAIAAAKAGVEGLVRSAAATYASRGLRFHAVAPGLVRTPMSEHITSNARSVEASISMHALGRIGEPEDVASAIAWLLDPRNSWLSGEVLRVDGGLGSLRPTPRR
jgi:NAD(P)-dependent dehydrogenase (short-subunit alcohol dehydrogenase family)